MGKKVYYEPILRDGDHLVSSKNNPDRVRGVSRDKDNKNPDIPEWRRIEIEEKDDTEDMFADSYLYGCEDQQIEQTQEDSSNEDAMVNLVLLGGLALGWAVDKLIGPRLKKKNEKAYRKEERPKREERPRREERTSQLTYLSTIPQINATQEVDNVFYNCQFNMGTEELRKHMMNMIYHMLGMVNEIRIMRNAIIRDNSETETMYFERQRAFEQELLSRVANNLNYYLSNESLMLDVDTSRQVFRLLDGGIYMNNRYVPVRLERIDRVMREQSLLPGNNY